MSLSAQFNVAKEGSPQGSEEGPLPPWAQGRLPGGGRRFECTEARGGAVGKEPRVSKGMQLP